jgi:LacI family transcriptional regulator
MKRVAVILDTSREMGRAFLRGIHRFQKESEGWQLHLELGNADRVERMQRWQGDGIIARVRSREVGEAIMAHDVPAVLDRDPVTPPEGRVSPIARFPWRDEGPGAKAVEHLLSRGLRRLAFCGFTDRPNWGRDEAMRSLCEAHGVEMSLFVPELGGLEDEPGELRRWVRRLEKPVGIWAVNDERGFELIEACRAENISVPDSVAVLGTDDDVFLCELSTPTLSSVRQPAEDVAYWGAAYLDALMRKEPLPELPPPPPQRVVLRGSTDSMSCEDVLVRKAAQIIRDKVDVTSGVEDLVRTLGVSRRTLERRFVASLGRTPGDELRRRRVERAASLLERTELSAAEVAAKCGFGAPARLTEAMRREMGVGPSEYRRRLKSVS